MKTRKDKGITLIALVITIIVLLILAAVSIATLTGENGILTRAADSKEETGQATAKEKVEVEVLGSYDNNGNISIEKLNENLENVTGLTSGLPIELLPATVEVDGYEIMIGDNGNTGTIIRMPEYQTENTKPYLPSNNFSQVEDTNLDNGLVITDGTNNWVWIEVPKSIYTRAKSENDYEAIENDMETYTETLVTRDGYEDVWYDGEGKTAEESTNLNDATGCGLTYEEYNNLKKYMLSSVYKNGGFWVGQTEAGSSVVRKDENAELTIPIVQEGAYPYNYITCPNAQIQSKKMNSGNYTSSLMFGIQWDLVLKHIEHKQGKTLEEIKDDSVTWGNYYDAIFEMTRGKYSIDNGISFIEVNGTYPKPQSNVLLATGEQERNSVLNIYDLAGNVSEWTLEYTGNIEKPCCTRGGYFRTYGYYLSSSSSDNYLPINLGSGNGFRPTIY